MNAQNFRDAIEIAAEIAFENQYGETAAQREHNRLRTFTRSLAHLLQLEEALANQVADLIAAGDDAPRVKAGA